MKTIGRLRNPIQEYAWGSHTAIAELLDQPFPTKEPQAELWMGAHPKGPSTLYYGGKWTPLSQLLQEKPVEILGARIAKDFSNQLPFLFKILAAAKPLSIQAHPNQGQAIEGFARENSQRLPLDSYRRNYRDANHKPEIICALGSFWALKGFRKIDYILSSLRSFQVRALETEISVLAEQPNQVGLKKFFKNLMTSQAERNCQVVEEVLKAANQSPDHQEEAAWMNRLQNDFPGDIGVLSPILLNLVQLQPGEAMYLPAGELHAYLEGVGIELMSNSDNVLRGGLTEKHVDVEELLRVLTFESRGIEILSPVKVSSGEKLYQTPAKEFRLASIELKPHESFTSRKDHGVEILICIAGCAQILVLAEGIAHTLERGESVLIPAAVSQYRITGEATVFRADVPD